jgi:phage/plasmid-associated DNA primase
MDSLFEYVDTRDNVLKILANCIFGKRVFEEFFVFSGVCSNGKSTLIKILEKQLNATVLK